MNSGRTPEEYRDFFAAAFAEMDARPRRSGVRFMATDLEIDFADGNPVFRMPGLPEVRSDFRRRWLPEHPVPLRFRGNGVHVLVFEPASGNRVKVRRALFRR